jgi:hypothetical protein
MLMDGQTDAAELKGAHALLRNSHFHLEDGGSMVLQNAGVLPHHYIIMSQPRRQHESLSCKWNSDKLYISVNVGMEQYLLTTSHVSHDGNTDLLH